MSSSAGTTAGLEAVKLSKTIPPSINDDPLSKLSPAALASATSHLQSLSFSELLRSYLVFLACSSNLLVDIAPATVDALESIRDNVPLGLGHLLWQPFIFVMKHTFFAQFVAGETAAETEPLLAKLRELSCGAMLNWSAEAQPSGSMRSDPEAEDSDTSLVLQESVDELTRAIQAIAEFQPGSKMNTTMLAIKLTGLVPDESLFERGSEALISSTSYARGERLISSDIVPAAPYISQSDLATLQALYQHLRSMCSLANKSGIRLAFDAEQSWLQPCLDRMVEMLSIEFNRNGRLVVYNTYQANLKRTEHALQRDLAQSRELGYTLGVKLVRGAYVTSENAHARKKDVDSAIWDSKAGTDECFDTCARLVLAEVVRSIQSDMPGPSVIFATHNTNSVQDTLMQLRKAGMIHDEGDKFKVEETLRGRVVYAQLMAMADSLTSTLLDLLPASTDDLEQSYPMNSLYVPYGKIDKVLPYLLPRAQENKTILQGSDTSGRGGAAGQRRAVGREIRQRLFPSLF